MAGTQSGCRNGSCWKYYHKKPLPQSLWQVSLYVSTIDSTDRRGNCVSNISGLVSFQVQEAESGQRGKLVKHLTKFQSATWNVGSLKKHDKEVVETLTRRKIDLFSVQEHGWAVETRKVMVGLAFCWQNIGSTKYLKFNVSPNSLVETNH